MPERSEWLQDMRSKAEALYDRFAWMYWEKWGFDGDETQLAYLRKFLQRVKPGAEVLSAGCGAGRYDGLVLNAGHPVLGIDQSAGMLARARAHFPMTRYEKIGLQEMAYHEEFAGLICIDALEHVSPEDHPTIICKFQQALVPGGVAYFNVDWLPEEKKQASFERARALGLPVVFGEVADQVEEAYARAMALEGEVPGDLAEEAVYEYAPSPEQAREWVRQAGLMIEEEGEGDAFYHFLVRKKDA
jgi:trans-aconitate methyltransferase